MKKISIVGGGSAGSMAAAYFGTYPDFEVDWYLDENNPPVSVGEASQLNLPTLLEAVGFNYSHLPEIEGTIKTGIQKVNWGGTDFHHTFKNPNVAMHFNAYALQNWIKNSLSSVVNIYNKKVDVQNLDTDYIVNCSGTPEKITESEFKLDYSIPVNSTYVVRIPWSKPELTHSLHIARPYGWVFGVPTQTYLSLGYQFNSNFNSLKEIQEDFEKVLNFVGYKTDVDAGKTFSYKNYSRKNNFTDQMSYIGNSSYFLEPLEATSLFHAGRVIHLIHDVLDKNFNTTYAQKIYDEDFKRSQVMIMLHYLSGSLWDTDFWEFAKTEAEKVMVDAFKTDVLWHDVVNQKLELAEHYGGGWVQQSFNIHFNKLDVFSKLKKLQKKVLEFEV